ncbi:uncharacterized protein EI97DRAFT_460412 [Westerdykella ornata]|uniref:Histone chaperone domain-containing protein n=1 Tax=Westerdykella ornata TaxID=318751 RepID=A0A6A6JDE8_WESOR|nr:uncharacterized protein EI97DRAFT_460412 [Westerdykella ornata]KAF2274295.1 hypothetical protein EI97DRAFT_460412 [Westerdykella ornata]
MTVQDDHQMGGVEETNTAADKGKGKAPNPPAEPQVEEEDDSSEESGAEEPEVEIEEVEDEDAMDEIDTSNVLPSRTRGKTIDYAKAAEELGEEDDDEDDDEDFQGDDAMEE